MGSCQTKKFLHSKGNNQRSGDNLQNKGKKAFPAMHLRTNIKKNSQKNRPSQKQKTQSKMDNYNKYTHLR